ncbi:unnamed protein product [Chironomus riparius]|uniref:Large ribosomal subunit protein bL28m n=1 Tax=Chironomus riparius TaxID=315576 RepID=A0A9N9RIX3_9DIPT|nr:unnamed protein product [Chironomus riparius]
MASATKQGAAMLRGFVRKTRFDTGLGAELPPAYRKFWKEWKEQQPAAVHYVPKEGMFERKEETGEVHPVQNVPLPLKSVDEENYGLWGGEAIIQGFTKKKLMSHRVPRFWVPTLKRSVVRSEILDEFFSVTVTERTIRLIFEYRGLDHYLLMSPACDLRSVLALKIKRRILQDIVKGIPAWQINPEKQKELMKEYRKYLDQYTAEEIDWYGLTWMEAINKRRNEINAENPTVPHKIIFRQKLIEQLREAGIKEVTGEMEDTKDTSWLKRLNPFAKKEF